MKLLLDLSAFLSKTKGVEHAAVERVVENLKTKHLRLYRHHGEPEGMPCLFLRSKEAAVHQAVFAVLYLVLSHLSSCCTEVVVCT